MENSECKVPEFFIGDGYCDDNTDNQACNFDRNEFGISDCCGFNGEYCQYCYCNECKQHCP